MLGYPVIGGPLYQGGFLNRNLTQNCNIRLKRFLIIFVTNIFGLNGLSGLTLPMRKKRIIVFRFIIRYKERTLINVLNPTILSCIQFG